MTAQAIRLQKCALATGMVFCVSGKLRVNAVE